MFTDIRHWAKALFDWAEAQGFDIHSITNTHYELSKSGVVVYINVDELFHWKVTATRTAAMSGYHVVVDEDADLRVRIRHGYVGALKVAQYPKDVETGVKLADATLDIAMLMDEPLRSDLMVSLGGEAVQ